MSIRKLVIAVAFITSWGITALAQDARVPVKVYPPEAYVFLDGVAIKDGNVTLKTSPGEHVIAVYNYGFKGEARNVKLEAGNNEMQSFNLQRSGDAVPGEFGFIQIEGPGRAAVLLNGKTPEYHVGHVDMFNNHIGNFQQLLVLPGTHEVTVTRNGSTIWSGPVEVKAGERVILRIPSGERKVQQISDNKGPRPRFTAGTASAAVVIAPVSATLAATPQNINCNEKSQLAYSSADALRTTMKDDADVKKLPDLSGKMEVEPRHTTTYEFVASGPGGVAKQQAIVNVNPVVQSTLEATPGVIHYVKVGNDVLVQDTADVKWTITNADTMSLSPMGAVAASGQEKIKADPKATTGKVDEAQSYTLTATNVCGGSDTKTVQLQTKGMIEPYMLSVFFPTGYPDRKHPDAGLLASQQERLLNLAGIYPLYAEHSPEAKIVIRGYADPRGRNKANMKLSERRIEVTRAFLVAHGVPADKITIEPLGETQQLDRPTVEALEAENPFRPADGVKQYKLRTIRLAYNRRVDIELQPAELQTSRFLPYATTEEEVLLKPNWPSWKAVNEAQQAPTVATIATETGQ